MTNLIDELAEGYVQSKYDEKYLKEKIDGILKFILPKIAVVIKNKEEKEPVKLWNTVREDEKIDDSFEELFEKIDRLIVIYVVSKFKNNQYFGRRIIEEALKLQKAKPSELIKNLEDF